MSEEEGKGERVPCNGTGGLEVPNDSVLVGQGVVE